MEQSYSFPCPNCGSLALRRHFVGREAIYSNCLNRQVMITECPICDYLMTMCSLDGRVLESSNRFSPMLPKKSQSKSETRFVNSKITA